MNVTFCVFSLLPLSNSSSCSVIRSMSAKGSSESLSLVWGRNGESFVVGGPSGLMNNELWYTWKFSHVLYQIMSK